MNTKNKDDFFSSHNQPVESYLDFFLAQDAPQFAVLLTGHWGCGKTWFINKYLENRKPDDSSLKFSVAGCKNANELSSRYVLAKISSSPKLEKLHTKISKSRFGKLLTGSLGGFLESKDEYALMGDALFRTPKLIVIDDIERTELKPKELVGFINNFVEGEKVHVILLANEQKLQNADDDFEEVKEKVIGQTFLVKSELDSAILEFIDKVQPPVIQQTDIRNCSDIVFSNSQSNLRSLKQALYDYKRLHQSQSDFLAEIDEQSNVYAWLFFEVLIYRVGINTKMFDQNDLKARSKYPHYINSMERQHATASDYQNEYHEELKVGHERVDNFVQKNFSSIDPSHSYTNFLSADFVLEFFCEGLINSYKFAQCFRTSRFFEKESPEWLPLIQYLYLDNVSEFESLYNKLWNDLKEVEYLHPGDFLHIVGIFISFSQKGFGKSIKEIMQCAEHYLNTVEWTKVYLDDVIDDWDRLTEWGGRQYQARDSEAFKAVSVMIENKFQQQKKCELKETIKELPSQIVEIGESALSWLTYDGGLRSNKNNSYQIPVLLDLDPEGFVDATLTLDPQGQLNVFSSFAKRYTTREEFTETLSSEIRLVNKIQSYLNAKLESSDVCQLTRLRIKYILENYIDVSQKLLSEVQTESMELSLSEKQ